MQYTNTYFQHLISPNQTCLFVIQSSANFNLNFLLKYQSKKVWSISVHILQINPPALLKGDENENET